METIVVNATKGETMILVGASYHDMRSYLPSCPVFVITDRNVEPMVRDEVGDWLTYVITPGEHSKSLREATEVYRWLQGHHADRKSLILALGGGVVCDLAGFVAATYLRGVALALVPTTLLAQVDASIGGKNAVNLDGFKNIVGTVSQPQLILCDTSFLSSLPEVELLGGVAEMLKHAIIGDRARFDFFLANSERVLAGGGETFNELISWSIQTKRSFVEQDEFDNGIRRKLNFGHTWGHGVESVTGMHHGFAVSIGMVFAARFGAYLGLTPPSVVGEIEHLMQVYGLPTEAKVLPWVVYEALLRDKKKDAEHIHFVFPRAVGDVFIERVALETVRTFINSLR